jgi:hypothetical protein
MSYQIRSVFLVKQHGKVEIAIARGNKERRYTMTPKRAERLLICAVNREESILDNLEQSWKPAVLGIFTSYR